MMVWITPEDSFTRIRTRICRPTGYHQTCCIKALSEGDSGM